MGPAAPFDSWDLFPPAFSKFGGADFPLPDPVAPAEFIPGLAVSFGITKPLPNSSSQLAFTDSQRHD